MAIKDARSSTWTRLYEWWQRLLESVDETVYILRKNRLTLIGSAMVAAVGVLALLAPYIVPYPEHAGSIADYGNALRPPSREHLFGTDRFGRDIFTRVLLGARISIRIAIMVIGLALSVGVPLGLAAGYLGGRIEMVIMRITDVFISIPRLVLPIAIAGALGPSLQNVMIALSITWWPSYVRLLRSEVKEVAQREYVQAAEGLGASRIRVMFRHVLPNSFTSVLVQATMDMGWVILAAAALSFIGIGASSPIPEWGLMISNGREFMPGVWWWSFFPGLFIFIIVMGFNLAGDGLRDILDPRSRLQ